MIEPRPLPGDASPRTRAPVGADRVPCPQCGTELEIAEVLADRVRAEMRAQIAVERGELRKREAALRERLEGAESEIATRVSERMAAEREALRAEARRDAATENEALQERLASLTAEVRAAKKAELEVLREKEALERQKEELELTVARRLDAERARIRAEAKAEDAEQNALLRREHEEKLEGMRRKMEEMQRKLDQGSQQTQGEALEVGLEELLAEAFPGDVFEPVPKGYRGADLIQRVRTPAGVDCGTILWEAKRTKNWVADWLPKLRDDQRALKAEIAALVSVALPKDAAPISSVDNVWVTNYACVVGLAHALRNGLVEAAGSKLALQGRSEKMEVLYGYLSGPEFRNRIEGLLEPFLAMRAELEREKRATHARWARCEKQIDRAQGAVSGLYGDMQGIVGAGLPEIEALDLPALDEGEPAS